MVESPSSFELDNRIFFRLFQAANLMHKQGTRALAEQRTTTQEWSILGALSRREIRDAQGMSVGDLCDYLMVTRQNLAGTLKRLESAGLIERTADAADGRARRLQLTRDGERRWRQLQPLIRRFYGDALQGLSFDERATILHYLNRLRDNLAALS